jgi:IS605 OrfB family transposase
VVKRYDSEKCKSFPVLKKPVVTWNNQNYRVEEDALYVPLWVNGKSQRIRIAASMTAYQIERLQARLGSLRVTRKNGKWVAQVAVEAAAAESKGQATMGVDLGLKVPAVAVTDTGRTKFIGNGRRNKYMKRMFRARRWALGKAKKKKAVKKLGNKEQRWMREQDHKASREVVNFAKANHVSVIRLEQLDNIYDTASTSRKNEKNLHTWSFYRLGQYIAYKAALAGIKVVFVNPAHTSQTCPACGKRNHAKDRRYTCSCGYVSHRDRVGAINIINAPVASGKRKPA